VGDKEMTLFSAKSWMRGAVGIDVATANNKGHLFLRVYNHKDKGTCIVMIEVSTDVPSFPLY